MAVKLTPVARHDAGGFLAAVLQRVQAQRGMGGGIGIADDAEHAALFFQVVAVERIGRQRDIDEVDEMIRAV